jgi:hypothetical protein
MTAVHGRDAVKVFRFSIGKLMAIVGVVALNFVAIQFWSPSSEPSLLTGRFLMSIALQVGLLCLIRTRRTGYRTFWWGFVSFGLAASITTIYIDLFSPGESELFNAMDQYLFSTFNLLERICMLIPDPYFRSRVRTAFLVSDNRFTSHLMFDFVSFLPQFLIALSGGVLTSVALRLWKTVWHRAKARTSRA